MFFGKTDIGSVRKENEDNFICFNVGNLECYIVCDGMGGAKGGKVASDICVKKMLSVLKEELNDDLTDQDTARVIKKAIATANEEIFRLSAKDKSLFGMGTTVVTAVVKENRAVIAHLGDSRAYLYKNGKITKITKDHSYVQELVDIGKISAEEAESNPKRNIITKAVGVKKDVEVDIDSVTLKNGILLLCTDGLYTKVTSEDMVAVFKNYKLSQTTVESLVFQANKNGGEDNITVVICGGDDLE